MKKFISLILAALMLAGALAVAALAEESPFSDVKVKRWSYKAIKYAYDNKYMDGVGGGKFDPAGTMTRAMVVTVLYRMEKTPEVEFEAAFSDVKDGKYYSRAVIWAKDHDIVNGVSEGVFDPDGKITREQLSAMLYRYSVYKDYNPMGAGDADLFPDAGSAHSYAKDPLDWAASTGLITGVKSGGSDLLDPRGNATREQFATILMRFDDTYPVRYNDAAPRSHYTEKEYPLVDNADIYVSPDGDDNDPGSFGKPIATFARAVEMVRALKTTVTDRSIIVAFKAGEYHEDNITMTAEDSGTKEYPVIYCGYGDGEAVITGGAIIKADRFEPVDEDKREWFDPGAVDKIKKVNVGEILPSFNAKDVIFGEQGMIWLARFPDKYPDGTDKLMKGAGSTISESEIRISMPAMKRRILSRYHTIEGLKLYGYLTLGWYKDTLDVGGYTVDEETGDLDFYFTDLSQAYYGRLRYGEFPWEEYHASAFLNMSEDLDSDGEYWLDADGDTLYVYDPRGSYIFPEKDRGIIMDRCDYVTFRGLTVTAYRDKLLAASDVAGLVLDRCSFAVCSSDAAVKVTGRRGTDFDTAVTGCGFSVFTGNAVDVDGGFDAGDPITENVSFLFDNNYVTRTNLTEWGAAVGVSRCCAAVLSHNEFENMSHIAIGSGGHDNVNNVIEYNVFRNVLLDNQDCGAFSFGNSQGDWGNKIRYNVFYPTVGDRYAIYLDDNEPAAEIYGNLFLGTTIVIHDGRSNVIRDNVMVDSTVLTSVGGVSGALERYAETGDPEEIFGDGRANAFYTRWVAFFDKLDSDPAVKQQYFTAFPELASFSLDVGRANDPSFVLYPRNYVRNNAFFSNKQQDVNAGDGYGVFEGNRCFRLSENPCFVNPSAGDYRIVEGSGAPEIYFEKIGRY